jgi:hypothetical protein
MNVTVIKEDRVVAIDGEALNFDFELASNIWAIQWSGAEGHIEFKDGTPNEELTDFSGYQYLADAHATEKQRVADEKTKAQADMIANRTYAEKRKTKYDALNQFEMQYDDLVNTTTTWSDAIAAIKLEIPKE